MDIVLLLSSISKIGFVAFIGTSVFLGYEIYLFHKENVKKSKPVLPQFSDSFATTPVGESVVIKEKKKVSLTRADNRLLIFLIILFVLFGLITVVGLFGIGKRKGEADNKLNAPIVVISSKGIHVYDENFNLLSDVKVGALSPGTPLVIGVETIPEADIDRARIRINKEVWDIENITVDFDKAKNVYFRKYLLATGESKLKIEGQLHSKIDGWLGD